MKNWFSRNAKLKRWMLVFLFGIILFCFSISKILVLNEITIKDIIQVIVTFTLGFVFSIYGLIGFNKRTIELALESSDDRTQDRKNININKLIYNKKIYDGGPNIVVIGGGTGINSVLEGLKNYTNNITAIIDTSDYGADETFSRRMLKTIPLTDIRESLIALSPKQDIMSQLLTYRFDEKSKLNGLEFSDIFFSALRSTSKNYVETIKKSGDILNITGKVLPVTQDTMNIIAELENGLVIDEKDKIEKIVYERFTKINRVLLNPSGIKPAPGVLEAIKKADAIIIRPGALYTNVIPNLLVNSVAKTVRESKGLKIYISNIMTTPGQTDDYTLKDHIKTIIDHAGNIIDYCIYDTGEIEPSYIKKYNKQGQELIRQEKGNFKNIHFIKRDLSCVKNGFIRHDSKKIAKAIIEVVCEDLKFKDKQKDPEYLMLQNRLRSEYIIDKNKKKRKRKPQNKKVLNKKSKWGQKYEQRIVSMKEADNTLNKAQKQKQKVTAKEKINVKAKVNTKEKTKEKGI